MNIKNKNFLKKEALVFALLFFAACSSLYLNSCKPAEKVSVYQTGYPLSDKDAFSLSGGLKVKVPQGWFASEDGECGCISIWLIRKDFSASLNFVQLNADSLSGMQTLPDERSKIETILAFSQRQRQSRLDGKFSVLETEDPRIFFIDKRPFGTYQYKGDEGLPVRTVVFLYGSSAYEVTAMPASETGRGSVDPAELFRVQQTLISSIK